MADQDVKKTAIQLLVTNGILSQEEADECIDAIARVYEKQKGRLVYQDENIALYFKGIEALTDGYEWGGFDKRYVGYEFYFGVQNKSDESAVSVDADQIFLNRIKMQEYGCICKKVPPKEYRTGSFSVFCEGYLGRTIKSVEDIKRIGLEIVCERESNDGRAGYRAMIPELCL